MTLFVFTFVLAMIRRNLAGFSEIWRRIARLFRTDDKQNPDSTIKATQVLDITLVPPSLQKLLILTIISTNTMGASATHKSPTAFWTNASHPCYYEKYIFRDMYNHIPAGIQFWISIFTRPKTP